MSHSEHINSASAEQHPNVPSDSIRCQLIAEIYGWYIWKLKMITNHHRIITNIKTRKSETRNGILKVTYYSTGAIGNLDEESPDFYGYLPDSTLKVNCLLHGDECTCIRRLRLNYYTSFVCYGSYMC